MAVHVRVLVSLVAGALVASACAAGTHAPASAPMPTNADDASTDAPIADSARGVARANGADARADSGGYVHDTSMVASIEAPTQERPCPPEMVLIYDVFCIDRFEDSLIELMPDGSERAFPSNLAADNHDLRAVSARGVIPQAYISAVQADDACVAAGKRLCELDEWRQACRGPDDTDYPYGHSREVGRCNDDGRSPVAAVFPALLAAHPQLKQNPHNLAPAHATHTRPLHGTGGATPKAARLPRVRPRSGHSGTAHGATGHMHAHSSAPISSADSVVWSKLNDPALGLVPGSIAKTAERQQCVNEFGVFDMVGNRHEWVADVTASGNGIFAGGYFLDVQQNGEGCNYRTEAHATTYHDYSTGFRCCKDPESQGAP